jgi:uncharacterized membrane protein
VRVDLYETLKSIHVLAVVIWVGGAFVVQFFAVRAQRADDPARVALFAKDAEWVGQGVFMPASLVVLASGIWAVIEGSWSWGDVWVLWGLGGAAFSAVLGATFLGPESGRIGALIGERGASDPEAQRRISRIYAVSRIELVILFSVVLVMVIKPGA